MAVGKQAESLGPTKLSIVLAEEGWIPRQSRSRESTKMNMAPYYRGALRSKLEKEV